MDFHILDSVILWAKCQNEACVCPRVQQQRVSAVFALHYQMNLSAVRGASASAAKMLINEQEIYLDSVQNTHNMFAKNWEENELS